MASHENPPLMVGISARAITFLQADGNSLCAWFYVNPNAKFTMLVSHGNLGNMQTHSYLTEALIRAGYSVFIYDYSGYGASSGKPDLSTVTKDAEAAYDCLIGFGEQKAENIILYGESIGASVSAHLATVRAARAIICQSGFCSLRKIAVEKMPLLKIYPEFMFPHHSLDTITNIRSVKIPLLIMHGEKDDIVPFAHGQMIFASACEPKLLVSFSNCDHKNVTFADRGKFMDVLEKFLQPIIAQTCDKGSTGNV